MHGVQLKVASHDDYVPQPHIDKTLTRRTMYGVLNVPTRMDGHSVNRQRCDS